MEGNLLQAIEQACVASEVPETRVAAEATLVAFIKSPQPYHACQYIIAHSRMGRAKFHAAAAMQEAAIREWALLSPEEKTGYRTFCLQYVMANAGNLETYVQTKILSVVASLLKRGWLEFGVDEKNAFFHEVQQVLAGAHGLSGLRSGISLLEVLISEFSPSTATAMGLPAEFHEHCRASLELDYLQKFYAWAQEACVMVAGKDESQEASVCTSIVHLMTQILSWEFQGNARGVINLGKNRASAFSSFSPQERRSDHTYLAQLGPAWYDVLVSPERVTWLLNLYSHARKRGLNFPLAVVTRQLIVLLCSVNGSIFPPDGGATHEKHLQRLLGGVITWIDPPSQKVVEIVTGASESELLEGCRALLAIATLGSASTFDQLLKQPSGTPGTFALLASLTCEVIKAHRFQDEESTAWHKEALNVLLDVWTVLLQPTDLSKRIQPPQAATEAAAAVFRAYVELEMEGASADDTADETAAGIDARDERLAALAVVARAAPSVTLPFLGMLVSNCCTALHQCSSDDPRRYRLLEQLYWLIIMSGHLLADPGEGETPSVPESILASSTDPNTHPAVILSWSIIEIAQRSLDPSFRTNLLSPRLMEAVVWFFGRWVGTYLMPADAGRGPNSTPSGHEGDHQVAAGVQFNGRTALNAAFGKAGGGSNILDVLVRLALNCLTSWPGELCLQSEVSFRLIPALVQRSNICTVLITLDPWRDFAAAFARQEAALLSLPVVVQRALSESLCRSVQGMPTDAANQCVKDLLSPVVGSFTALSESPDLVALSQQPYVIHQVSSLLEILRGAARATTTRSQKGIFEVGVHAMKPLLRFLHVYKNQPTVVYLLLKYVVDWVDGQVAFLASKDTALLFNFCVQLLGVYSTQNIGKVSISSSQNVLNETQSEKYKDLRALLQLLTHLSSKDLVDFACDSDGELENPDVARVVFLGLNIITPLISVELLKFPKLCRQYFQLIVHMLEVYPEKVAKLPSDAFNQIVRTLEFGLRHQDVEVVNMTLTALSSLAFFHYQAKCVGQEGLGELASAAHSSNGILDQFLRSLMQFLLFEDYSNELIEAASDALLPLILCNPPLYQKLIQELIDRQQHNVNAQARLAAAFQLISAGDLDRSHRWKFSKSLFTFLNDVRGFLRTR